MMCWKTAASIVFYSALFHPDVITGLVPVIPIDGAPYLNNRDGRDVGVL